MRSITINDIQIQFEGNKTILEVARENGIDIPTLCYLKECNDIGSCGVCVVEIEGQDELSTSCNTLAKQGMNIKTNTEKVTESVKSRVSNLLDEHEFKCGPCKRRENCEFLKLVIKTKARASKPFIVKDKTPYLDERSSALVIDRTKCVKCGRCVAACEKKTETCSIKFIEQDGKKIIAPTNNEAGFDKSKCLLCGQCVTVCPVDALYEKSHIERVKEALEDEDKHVVVAIAPAVRTSMGELFGMGYGVDTTGKIYASLRELGFDKVFDINFGADVTIMEEATELLQRLKDNGPFPMFTSCCPGWVRQVKNYYPDYLNNLSTAKSPQQIFGAISKSYYPKVANIDPKKVFTVTIMPCIVKKSEADMEDMAHDGLRDIDAVLTTRELAKMIKEKKINFKTLEDQEADPVMGEYTGAAVLFGATGGVMEAAIRTAKDLVEEEELEHVDYEEVRGLKGIKEATITLGDKELNLAVVNGAKNLFEFIKSGKIKEKQYHFIEVMACEGGCVSGGGQPHVSAIDREKIDIKTVRASVLYNQDKNAPKRKSHKNEAMIKMYETFMGEPGKGKAHELLHHKYTK